MVFPHRTALLIFLVTFALVIGCSGGGGEAPTSPDLPDNELTSDVTHSGANDTYIWEIGEVILDTENLEVSVVPIRTIDFTCNITMFLQPPNGNPSNLGVSFDIANCDFPNAYVDLDCTLTHPFPGTQYWGFDVRVIVFGGGSTVGVQDATLRYPASTELRMVNADGYTRWWNRDEFGPFNKLFGYTDGIMAPAFTTNFSIVNGYKYFAEDVVGSVVPPNPGEATRGVFSADAVTREMLLQFPQVPQPFKFKYSVSASWAGPASNPPSSVDDFGPDANQQEAYQIVVTQDSASDAFYDPDTGDFGGDLILDVECWDWQAEGDAGAQIVEVWIESPTLLATQGGAVEITGTWTAGPGTSANSVIYSGTLVGCTPEDVEGQELFITVVSESPTTYEPPLGGFLYPDAPLAAYQLYEATILDAGIPPVPSITVISPNGGETLVIGETYEITWSSTGPIADVVIEYDINGGGDGYPNTIVGTTPNTGGFTWDPIPDTPSVDCMLRITDAGTTGATDTSDDVWAISLTAEQGWNAVPGQIRLPVEDPVPNQSTVSPDFGIQIDDLGNEGAWIVDQEGGIPDGTPYFVDYLLDWSGPGGDAYPSGFNFNFAPFGRHDASSNAIALFGCSYNTDQTNPPVMNDPATCIWYLSYLLDDETAVAGDLHYVTWGDAGTIDPPEDDPDAEPWYHTCDVSGGLKDVGGDQLGDCSVWLMCYSNEADPFVIPQEETGDLNIGFWDYPFLTGEGIYRLGFPEYTTDNEPAPLFQAFDVTDPNACRMGADTDSYLTFTEDNGAHMCYMLDSLGNWYGTGFELDFVGMTFWYIGIENSLKIRTDDSEFYISGATAVDIEVLPTMTVLYEGDSTEHGNWVAVVFDTGGNFVVRVYRVDWTADSGEEISIIDTTDPVPGTPLAIDVDILNFTFHVLADNGGTIEATVFDWTP